MKEEIHADEIRNGGFQSQKLKRVYRKKEWRVEVITPSRARELLDNPAPNRRLHMSQVRFLASEIRKGNFRPNGCPIIIDQYGRLMDGQHRCKAIVMSGRPVRSDVIYGQNYEETCRSLGRHQGRSNIDNSVMFHPDLPSDTFSVAKSILSFETTGSLFKVNTMLNDGEIDDFINRNKDFFVHLKTSRSGHKPSYLKNFPMFKVMEYILGKIEKEKTADFFDRLFENTVEKNTPEWTLIRWLESDRPFKKEDGTTRLGWIYGSDGNRNFANALAIAWMAKIQNKKMERMKFKKPNGDSNVPDIYGMYTAAVGGNSESTAVE